MADKKIKVKVDVETDVEPSIAALKALKRQLKDTAAGSEEFLRLQKQIDDVQDSLAAARAGAGNFTDVLGGLPGPIGAIGGQASGLIATLKQFGALKVGDLQSSFVELGKDLGDVAKGFFDLTGITKVYTVLNTTLARSFVAVGVGETAAAAGAKAFAAALTATGIGALVVGLGLLIANWDKVADAITGATAESKTYEEAQVEVTKSLTDFNKKLIDVQSSFKAAKEGTISKEDALKKYNDTLGATVGYAGSLDQAEKLMASNTQVVIEGIKLRTQANVFYAKSAEAAAKAISGEGVDPSFWESSWNYIKSGGNMLSFTVGQAETMVDNFKELNENEKKFAAEGDKLTKQAIENDKKLKKGLAKPPDFSATKKASDDALAEVKKGLEEARLTLLGEQAKELELVKLKYDALAAKAKKFGKDTAIIEQARQKENATIRDKYAKQELEKAEKAAKELEAITKEAADKRTKELEDSFAREEGLLNLKFAKGELTEKEYQIELYNLRKEYAILNQSLVQEDVDRALVTRKKNQSITKANIKESLEKEQELLKTDLDNKKITQEEYAEKSLKLVRKYSELETALAYEKLQKEESELKTSLDKKEISQSEFNFKLLEKRKEFAKVVEQQSAIELSTQEANLKAGLDVRLNTLQTASQKEEDVVKQSLANKLKELETSTATEQTTLKESFDNKLKELQSGAEKEEAELKIALDKKEITQSEYDSKSLEIKAKLSESVKSLEEQNGTELENIKIKFNENAKTLEEQSGIEIENIKTKFNSDSLLEQSNYDTQINQLKTDALGKNKELVTAEIELSKYQLEEKKKNAEEERSILLTTLQAKFEALDKETERVDGDFEQDLVRIQEQREILAEQESIDLANEELTEFQKTEIRKKYADARIALSDKEIATEKAAMEAKHEINMAYLGLFEQFGNLLGQIAGKNKGIAIAGVVISQAAAIGQIVANTAIANAKSVAAFPLTGGMPWVAINTVSAGLSIASTIASAVKSIQQINSANANSPSGGGGVGGGASLPAAPSAPTVAAVQAPQIQTGQGINPTTQLAQTINKAQAPLKAYVVSGDVSSQQALDRRTNRAATFSGG